MKKNYRDEIAMVCHEMMEDLHKSGIVPDAEMWEFEKNCFADKPDAAPRSIGASATVTPAMAKRG
ncbi:hypothetical protein AGMMS49928_20230 [Spirochaetia bacterium]|nr:hypothetical protein AGMMS49928_20230 [Spirochaetia bacterium]